MRALVTAAVVALSLVGCGGPLEDETPVGTSTMPMESMPPADEPTRLSNTELFSGSSPVVVSPDDPTFADRYRYLVSVKKPCR